MARTSEKELTFIPLPIESIKLQPQLVRGDAKTKILEAFAADLGIIDVSHFDRKAGILKIDY